MELTAIEWSKYYNNVVMIDNSPWELRNRLLIPISPPDTIANINRVKVRKAIKETNALLAYWTDKWDSFESQWWWTVCDNKDYDIDRVQNSGGKRGIKKGLENCKIDRIQPEQFADLTYDIYYNSLLSYNLKSDQIITYNQYNEIIINQSKYKGFELWGAFIQDKLVSYATILIIDNVALLGSTKSNSEFHKYYPNNALFYFITKHYLTERGLSYITNGPRTLLHSTSINDFLIKLGYRKVYCKLNVEISGFAKLLYYSGVGRIIQSLKFFDRLFPHPYSKLNGFMKLVDISKTY